MTFGEWEYPPGSKIREKEEFALSVGGQGPEPNEYWIDRCLIDIETTSRFYYVKRVDDDSGHLYAASAIEGQYEVIEGGVQ